MYKFFCPCCQEEYPLSPEQIKEYLFYGLNTENTASCYRPEVEYCIMCGHHYLDFADWTVPTN